MWFQFLIDFVKKWNFEEEEQNKSGQRIHVKNTNWASEIEVDIHSTFQTTAFIIKQQTNVNKIVGAFTNPNIIYTKIVAHFIRKSNTPINLFMSLTKVILWSVSARICGFENALQKQ